MRRQSSSGPPCLGGVAVTARRRTGHNYFSSATRVKISPADAVALSSALHASTAGGAFFAGATKPAPAPVRASARLAQSIFLYSEAPASPAPGNTVPLRCSYSRSYRGLQTSSAYVSSMRQSHYGYETKLFWMVSRFDKCPSVFARLHLIFRQASNAFK
jgi:hypothetical protein